MANHSLHHLYRSKQLKSCQTNLYLNYRIHESFSLEYPPKKYSNLVCFEQRQKKRSTLNTSFRTTSTSSLVSYVSFIKCCLDFPLDFLEAVLERKDEISSFDELFANIVTCEILKHLRLNAFYYIHFYLCSLTN